MESKLSIPGKYDLDAQMEAYYDFLTGSERSEDAAWAGLAGSALASTESGSDSVCPHAVGREKDLNSFF